MSHFVTLEARIGLRGVQVARFLLHCGLRFVSLPPPRLHETRISLRKISEEAKCGKANRENGEGQWGMGNGESAESKAVTFAIIVCSP